MQQAVLHKAAPSNPVRELERIEEPRGKRTWRRTTHATILHDEFGLSTGRGLT
jgi:hypothetical protein